jgi:hypothetical protein
VPLIVVIARRPRARVRLVTKPRPGLRARPAVVLRGSPSRPSGSSDRPRLHPKARSGALFEGSRHPAATGSTAPSAATRTSRSSGRARQRTRERCGRTSSSTAASARLRPRRRRPGTAGDEAPAARRRDVRRGTDAAVRPAYVLGRHDYLHLAGKLVRTTSVRGGSCSAARRRPLRVAYRISGLYPDMWSGRTGHLHALSLQRRQRHVAFSRRRRSLPRAADRLRRRPACHVRAGAGVGRSPCRCIRRRWHLPRDVHRLADARARRTSSRAAATRAGSARGSRSSLHAVREDRLRRHAALASADGRRQLHPRRAAGWSRRRRTSTSSSRSARSAFAAGKLLDERSRGSRRGAGSSRCRSRTRPGAPGAQRAGRPRSASSALRRPPLHGLDVPAAALRRARDDDPRPRPAQVSGAASPADRAHAHRERRAARACDVVFTNSEFTAGDVVERLGIRATGFASRVPGVDASVLPRRRAPFDLGRPYAFTTATRRAAQEPRHAACGVARARRRGLQLPTLDERRLRSARATAAALPRRGGVRLPVAVRGVRDARRRGDGVGRAVRRLEPPSLDEASGDAAVRAIPTSPQAIAAAVSRGARTPRRARPARLEHARGSPGSRPGACICGVTLTRCDPRRDRRLAARADPRRDGAVHPRPAARAAKRT